MSDPVNHPKEFRSCLDRGKEVSDAYAYPEGMGVGGEKNEASDPCTAPHLVFWCYDGTGIQLCVNNPWVMDSLIQFGEGLKTRYGSRLAELKEQAKSGVKYDPMWRDKE